MFKQIRFWPPLKAAWAEPWGGGGSTTSHALQFLWRNAKSFCYFSPWEKAGLHFQCILKSTLHDKTMNELLIQCKSLYTLLHACTKQLCTWPCNLTENISECILLYPTQVFNVRQEVNKATAPEHAQANFSTRAVSILLLPHTSSPCTLP